MFKTTCFGITSLSLALALVTGTANASFKHCTSIKTGTTGSMASLCDVTFSATPAFANLCLPSAESGIYTITNNAPVAIRINYIKIKVNDGFPAAASTIVAAPTNNCVAGNSLPAGGSCNIQVNLLPLTFGTFNRVLQVGVNTRQVELDSAIISPVVAGACAGPTPLPGPFFPAGFNFTILGASTVTSTGLSAVNGNVGVSPGSAITGFPPGTVVNGTLNSNNAAAIAAQVDLTTAYNNLAAATCTTNLTGQNLGTIGHPLAPGVYCFNTSAQLTGALVLNGAGNYVFQIGTTLTTASASSVTLTGGAAEANVYWQIGSSATLGTNTAFQGNIVALTSITLNTGTSLLGRALARNGAVTLDTNAVNPN